MALLTAAERALLSRYSYENTTVNLAQKVADAQTLQFYGDSATSHIRIATNPLAGDSIKLEAGGAIDRMGVFDPGCTTTYEFTNDGTVNTIGNIPVLIGGTQAVTA